MAASALLAEDSYGRAKRQAFVESMIRESKPKSVLDFGCGTGTQLTRPLAQAFPDTFFCGVDSDVETIGWARRQAPLPNLAFAAREPGEKDRRYDMIIASEVLEHVEAPDALLREFHALLTDDGCLVVTVPNGYGAFEATALVEQLLTLGGVLPALRLIKHALLGPPRIDSHQALTLAVSPHINFFSLGAMHSLLREAGFKVLHFRSRTVFCGFIVDWVIRGPLIGWNATLADRLPALCASDWMFACAKSQAPAASSSWRRNALDLWRRRIGERRWAGVSLPFS